MPKLSVPKPPDPRPSKAHPVHRARRKELEKKHGGYEWVPYLGLALTGLVLAFDVEKDVERCEKRKEEKERDRDRDRDRDGDRDGDGGSDDGDGDRRRDRGQSSRRDRRRDRDRYEDTSRDRGDWRDRADTGRGRGRSLDGGYGRRGYRDYGRGDRESDRRRIEGEPREYDYYDGRREFGGWDERRGYDRRSAW